MDTELRPLSELTAHRHLGPCNRRRSYRHPSPAFTPPVRVTSLLSTRVNLSFTKLRNKLRFSPELNPAHSQCRSNRSIPPPNTATNQHSTSTLNTLTALSHASTTATTPRHSHLHSLPPLPRHLVLVLVLTVRASLHYHHPTLQPFRTCSVKDLLVGRKRRAVHHLSSPLTLAATGTHNKTKHKEPINPPCPLLRQSHTGDFDTVDTES